MIFMKTTFLTFLVFLFLSCNSEIEDKSTSRPSENQSIVKNISFTVMKVHPHDTLSFTEGLLIKDNKIYESTGSPEELVNTKSVFGIIDSSTGKIKVAVELDKGKYFGEGVTILEDRIFQLTYKNQLGFIYNINTNKNLGTFKYLSKEGWGLTNDSINLIMSDGTSKISFINPTNFNIVKEIIVSENTVEVENINELEYVEGFIYANIFTTTEIIKIDPNSGNVVGKINLKILLDESLKKNPNSLEMNGIAYSSLTKHFFITGKMWPFIFEIALF